MDVPHRFIIRRVLEMGWTSKRFEEFDQQVSSHGRGDNRTERIGKKYQWIALCEFLARATDMYPLHDGDRDWEKRHPYANPWQLLHHSRIDTSLLRVKDRDGLEDADDGWWVKADVGSFWSDSDSAWLLDDRGFPDPKPFLLRTAPDGSGPWAPLCAYGSWRQRDRAMGEEVDAPKRQVWMHIHCTAVHRANLDTLRAWTRRGHRDHLEVPEPSKLMEGMFGEFCWGRGVKRELGPTMRDPWKRPEGWRNEPPCPMALLAAEYVNESDPTFGSSLHALVPGVWTVEKLGLRAVPGNLERPPRRCRDQALTPFWYPTRNGTKACGGLSVIDDGADPSDLGNGKTDQKDRLALRRQGGDAPDEGFTKQPT